MAKVVRGKDGKILTDNEIEAFENNMETQFGQKSVLVIP
eukprot:Awhi_evm1s3910